MPAATAKEIIYPVRELVFILNGCCVACAGRTPSVEKVRASVQVLGAGEIQEAGAGKLGDVRSPEEVSSIGVPPRPSQAGECPKSRHDARACSSRLVLGSFQLLQSEYMRFWSSALLGDDPLVIAMESTRCHSEGVQYGHKSNKSPPQRCMLSCAPVLLHNLLSFVSHSPKFGALVGVAGSDRLQLRWNPAMLKYLYADNDVQCQDLAFSFTGM